MLCRGPESQGHFSKNNFGEEKNQAIAQRIKQKYELPVSKNLLACQRKMGFLQNKHISILIFSHILLGAKSIILYLCGVNEEIMHILSHAEITLCGEEILGMQ